MQKSKATQARILEDIDDEYEGEYEDIADEDQGKVMKISLNAMTGVLRVSSVMLVEKINGKEVSFLIISRATHNFVDPITAKRIGL